MGWNTGYTIFEQTVISAYDLGKLDKELLTVLMEPYRDTDIDSGGSCDLETKDGKRVEQVVIETWGASMPPKPEGEYHADPDAHDEYAYRVYDLFSEVKANFGW